MRISRSSKRICSLPCGATCLGTTSGASGGLRLAAGLEAFIELGWLYSPGNSTAAAEAASIPQPQSVTQRSVHCEGFIIHLGQMTHYRPETIVRIAKRVRNSEAC